MTDVETEEFGSIERLEFEDGTAGYQYGERDRRKAAAGSWDIAAGEMPGDIQWTVDDHDEPDPDDLVLIEAGTLAELYRMARLGAQYAGCSRCRRVTLV